METVNIIVKNNNNNKQTNRKKNDMQVIVDCSNTLFWLGKK